MAEATQDAGTTAAAATTATPAPEAGAEATGTTASPGADAGTLEQGTPEANDKPTAFTQKEVDRIVAKERRRLEREVERRVTDRVRAEEAERRLRETQGGGRGDDTVRQPKGKPQPKDFEKAEDYVEALTDWKLEQREKDRVAKTKTERSQKDVHEYNSRLMEACTRGADEMDVDDFEEVALDEDLDVTDAMAHAIAECEIPAKVLYHLGQNPAEARRIAKLKPTHQVRAIAEIETKLKVAPKTQTPPPIVPNDAKGASGQDPSKLSTDDWLKWRERDLKEKRDRDRAR